MWDPNTGRIDVEKLISCSDDLVNVLKDQRGISTLTHCLDQSKSLKSSCDSEFNLSVTLIQDEADNQKKIDECKQKTDKAKSEVALDASEMELLQKELEAELEKECVLMEELRVINKEINGLERQRISVEEQKQTLRKVEKDELRAQKMLSMYASVTNIIPNLDDHSKISGYIVNRDKKAVEKFEFDPAKMTAFDTCQSIWTMINQQ